MMRMDFVVIILLYAVITVGIMISYTWNTVPKPAVKSVPPIYLLD